MAIRSLRERIRQFLKEVATQRDGCATKIMNLNPSDFPYAQAYTAEVVRLTERQKTLSAVIMSLNSVLTEK